MSVVKIFDRIKVCDSIPTDLGLINIVDMLNVSGIDIDDISKIINSFICSDIFLLIFKISREICVLPSEKMIYYYLFTKDKHRCWFLHPILIKSVLRYINELIDKCVITRIVYSHNNRIDFYKMMYCSLLSIVENVPIPDSIKYSDGKTKKYICTGVMHKNDMFNDDHLIISCIKCIINDTLLFLPQCLCDIICSMVSL
jgi:hypothetical protein